MSVDAVQLRLICVVEVALAVRLVGALGGVVSGGVWVVAAAVLESLLKLFAASVARTR